MLSQLNNNQKQKKDTKILAIDAKKKASQAITRLLIILITAKTRMKYLRVNGQSFDKQTKG